jgi:hypothetical protein
MVLNGVQILNENWRTGASATAVIDYYRAEMAARGWRDVTEEALRFQPQYRNSGSGGNGLQDGEYLGVYRRTMDSTLIMSRGEWSLEIKTSPDADRNGETAVSICAAATPSLSDLFLQLSSSLSEAGVPGGQGRPVDVVQERGGERYHTTIAVRNEPPASAMRDALEDLNARGWRPAASLPERSGGSEFFAWLVRGAEYGALSVRSLPDGRRSSVALTEVTPAAQAGR